MAVNTGAQKPPNSLRHDLEVVQEKLRACQLRVAELGKIEERVKTLETELSQLKATRATYPALPASSPDDGRAAELEEAREKVKTLTGENTTLQEQVKTLTGENTTLQEQVKTLTGENTTLQEQVKTLNGENDRLRKQLEPFAGLLDIYDRYSALELVKANGEWREILPTDTPAHFLLCGSQTNTITSFWKKLRNCCESPGMADSPEWKVLLDVLRFLLEQYNSTLDTPVWEWMEDRAGARFDDERHTRDKSGSQYSGNIAKVLLPGIWNRRENRAVQKCVVVVATEGGMP